MWAYLFALILGAAGAAYSTWQVQEWRWTANTSAEREHRQDLERVTDEARQTDARQQRQFNDTASGRHAATVATLSNKLGDARAQIATLSADRQCLDARTVGMLNNLGTASTLGLRTPAAEPAGAAAAIAASETDHTPTTGYASERDTAEWIAICKTRHDELVSQVNQILDIEERRQQGAK